MNAQWRQFLAALGWVTRGIAPTGTEAGAAQRAGRFVPVVGLCIGFIAAAVYWAAAHIWPTSVAVILSMLAATLMTLARDAPRPALGASYWVFALLIKYNALMALSAAHVPLPLPTHGGLGFIMIAAQAASRSLVVSSMASGSPTRLTASGESHRPALSVESAATGPATRSSLPRLTNGALVIALILGFAPAVLLGIPGLIGLAVAIVMRLGASGHLLRNPSFAAGERQEILQQLTEVTFYLGALASWKYV